MTLENKNSLYIASVEKAFRLLTVFDRNASQLSLTQFAESTGLTLSNVQRLVYTLVELGFLARDDATKRYSLTTRALDIGYRYLQTSPILDRAAPYLAELSRRTEETVNLTILDGAEVVYLARHRGVHSIGVNVFIGARLPAFATGIGQVMLAFLPVLDATARLDALKRNQLTPHTITDLAALLKKLQRIRKAGYAVENQEMFLGGISIAAPILTRDNTALAALNVAVPTSRFTVADAERRFANVLLEIAREIRGPN